VDLRRKASQKRRRLETVLKWLGDDFEWATLEVAARRS
jgi:hypothetical protein